MSYQPMFTFLLAACYGPLPLLMVLADINRGIRENNAPPAKQFDRASQNNPERFMSQSLTDYYASDAPNNPPAAHALPVSAAASESDCSIAEEVK